MPSRKEDKNRGASSGAGGRRGGATSARGPLNPTALGALAALAAAILYLPAMQYGWIWDDTVLVTSKGASAGVDGFHPIASLLYRTEWLVGLGNPGLYHLTSILLHAVATWLVFLLARRLGAAWVAFGAALLFAAHPVHVEAVAYVSGRPDLLATVFALASLLIATSAPVCAPGGCRNWRVWPAYGLFALAALTEETALVTPVVLVLLDRVSEPRRTWRERRVVYAGFFGVLLATLLWRLGAGQLHVQPHAEVPAGAALAAPFVAAFDAMRAFVAPWMLNALRSYPESLAGTGAILVRAALPLLLLAAFAWWRRRDPVARAGAVLLALPLLPALPLPFFEGSYLMDRALMFASVGFCLLVASAVGWLAERLPGRKRSGVIVTVATAALLAFVTLARIPVWRDNVSLLQAATKVDPTDPKPHLLLSEHYVAAGDASAALAAVGRALAIDSTNADAYHKETAVLTMMGDFPRAEAAARKSVSLDAKDAIGWANLSDALARQGKTPEATDAARRAVALDSTNADNWYNLGVVLSDQKDLSEAIEAYRRVIAINPRHARAVNNMGALLGASGRLMEARDAYRRAVQVTPNAVEPHMNLALAYLRLGDKASAEEERKVILRLDPEAANKLPELLRGTAPAETKMPRGSGADTAWAGKGPIRIDPKDAHVVP